jgi:hypothetical protein
LDDCKTVIYSVCRFSCYNTMHYQSDIDFVTPQQAHNALHLAIVEEREAGAFSQRRRHREENQQNSGVQKTNIPRNIG